MACPVCFGDSNEPMALATNLGIWFMLAVVVAMLTAFASFFVYLMRRARLAASDSNPAHTAHIGREQEGTA
jgi:maltodextrin utilization protein YvdJ